ncbi:MAG: transketolase [Clostridiales bacterium]|nr:MAG: transketolase [Clostridiales bacterium]
MKSMLRQVYGNEIIEIAKENDKIVVLDGDLATSTKTSSFGKMFPDRFFNCGIAEQNMVSVAAGLAASGNTVFVSSFAMFLAGRAYDQIRNNVAYTNLNVKFVATHAGISVGEDGATHQCLEDIALMRAIPGMVVLVPSDAEQTRAAIRYAASHDGPVYIRLGRVETLDYYPEKTINFLSNKSFLFREGSMATLLFCGPFCSLAAEVSDVLEKIGLSVRIVDMPFVKPLDEREIIRCAAETGLLVTLEEHSIVGGFGSAVCECICGAKLSGRRNGVEVFRIGVGDIFGKSGKPKELMSLYGFTVKNIVLQIISACMPEYVNDISQFLT